MLFVVGKLSELKYLAILLQAICSCSHMILHTIIPLFRGTTGRSNDLLCQFTLVYVCYIMQQSWSKSLVLYKYQLQLLHMTSLNAFSWHKVCMYFEINCSKYHCLRNTLQEKIPNDCTFALARFHVFGLGSSHMSAKITHNAITRTQSRRQRENDEITKFTLQFISDYIGKLTSSQWTAGKNSSDYYRLIFRHAFIWYFNIHLFRSGNTLFVNWGYGDVHINADVGNASEAFYTSNWKWTG